MRGEAESVEGRTRRGREFAFVAVGLALLAALPVVYGLLSSDEAADDRPGATGPVSTGEPDVFDPGVALHGRLVYTTFETRGSADRQQRIWVLDLATGELSEGPLVPSVEELLVADAELGRIVIVADDAGAQGLAYVLTDLSPGARPREVASGDILSLSTDGRALIVGRTRPTGGGSAGCEPHAYTLHRVDLASGRERLLLRGSVECGNLVSATLHRELVVASFVERGRAEVRSIWPPNPSVMFPDLAHVSVSPRGTYLFVDPEGGVLKGLGVWPRTPTGVPLLWLGAGAPRPLVNDARLFAQRVVAWSPDGGHVVVNGIVRDERGMWLVYLPTGTAELLLPPNSFPLRSAFSGATFDDSGTVFAASPGRILAATDAGAFPIPLPPDAPSPVGPVVWLP
jgi:hypothetical protein